MCGPSSQETMIAGQAQTLSSLLDAHYQERFTNQSDLLGNLKNLLTPISEAGPDQQGFGANELAALNTQATEVVGQNYEKATRALSNQLAVRGGGNELLPSGSDAQLKEELASQAANQASNARWLEGSIR